MLSVLLSSPVAAMRLARPTGPFLLPPAPLFSTTGVEPSRVPSSEMMTACVLRRVIDVLPLSRSTVMVSGGVVPVVLSVPAFDGVPSSVVSKLRPFQVVPPREPASGAVNVETCSVAPLWSGRLRVKVKLEFDVEFVVSWGLPAAFGTYSGRALISTSAARGLSS